MNARMRVETLPEDKQPSSCIGCGMCTKICPQNIDIPNIMTDFVERVQKIPSWVQICKEREEAAKRNA